MKVTCWVRGAAGGAGALLLLLVLSASVAACGNPTAGATGAGSAETEAVAPASSSTTGEPTTVAPTTAATQSSFGPGHWEKSENGLDALVARVAALVAEDGVPVFLPDRLPPGFAIWAAPAAPGAEGGNPRRWPMSGPRPGPRAAGYSAAFTDGEYLVRLDVNAAADLGDVRWEEAGMPGVYGPLATTSAAGATTVKVPNPGGVEILVWGADADRDDVLAVAAAVRRAIP